MVPQSGDNHTNTPLDRSRFPFIHLHTRSTPQSQAPCQKNPPNPRVQGMHSPYLLDFLFSNKTLMMMMMYQPPGTSKLAPRAGRKVCIVYPQAGPRAQPACGPMQRQNPEQLVSEAKAFRISHFRLTEKSDRCHVKSLVQPSRELVSEGEHQAPEHPTKKAAGNVSVISSSSASLNNQKTTIKTTVSKKERTSHAPHGPIGLRSSHAEQMTGSLVQQVVRITAGLIQRGLPRGVDIVLDRNVVAHGVQACHHAPRSTQPKRVNINAHAATLRLQHQRSTYPPTARGGARCSR